MNLFCVHVRCQSVGVAVLAVLVAKKPIFE